MAQKKVLETKQAEMPYDIYIKGELVRVDAGAYVETDADGNVEVVSEKDYQARSAKEAAPKQDAEVVETDKIAEAKPRAKAVTPAKQVETKES